MKDEFEDSNRQQGGDCLTYSFVSEKN